MRPLYLLLACAIVPASARADVEVKSAFIVGDVTFARDQTFTVAGPTINVTREGNVAGVPYSLEVDSLITTGAGGTFFFKDDIVVKRSAGANLSTFLTLDITNDSGTAATLAFDSLIIPGHIAVSRTNDALLDLDARITFDVSLDGSSLYDAAAQLNADLSYSLAGQFDTLNGLTRQSTDNYIVFDWGATSFRVELGLFDPGETKTLVYSSLTSADAFESGRSFDTCAGAQVSWGDPRNRGGGGGSENIVVDGLAASSVSGDDPYGCDFGGLNKVIGLGFGVYQAYYQVVPSGSPRPAPPPPYIAPDYNAVPEPGALALLALGLGALATLRRR